MSSEQTNVLIEGFASCYDDLCLVAHEVLSALQRTTTCHIEQEEQMPVPILLQFRTSLMMS